MGSLSASLNIAVGSLLAEQGAIETTSNNIANVTTPGYSRQRADLTETSPIEVGNLTLGTGVQLQDVTSLRDSILDLRVNQETQQQGKLNAFIGGGQQIQSLFNETSGTGLQAPLTALFNSFQQLSVNPSDLTTRQSVITSAQNLAQALNQTSNNLTTQQQNTDLAVKQSVEQINSLTTQIAQVNLQVAGAAGTGANAGPFIDQRQQLINQLSSYVDVSTVDAGGGSVTLTTSAGTPLVVGGQSFALSTQPNATTGFQDIYSGSTNITSQITEGQLAGQLQLRDQEIPSIRNSLDTLAYNLSNAVNTQQQAGYDLSGTAGGPLFTPLTQQAGAAAASKVAITDPNKIAASGGPAPGNSGDNTNANALLALQNQQIVSGQTPIGYYGGLVFQVGNDVSSAQTQQQSGSLVLQQIQNLQGEVSGVDINEEAANLVRYQNAYQASAQVTSIINTLMLATINMASGV
ncbi:MAG TPA: flagellar hook-associated protein FlgK [Methylomirabilota bacterium]|nr:flagellar hook-associated protein FlgK [Methylomirabilota bacterium]